MYRTEIEFLLMEIAVPCLSKNQRNLKVFQVLVCMNLSLSLGHQIIFQERKLIIEKDQPHRRFIRNDLNIDLFIKSGYQNKFQRI